MIRHDRAREGSNRPQEDWRHGPSGAAPRSTATRAALPAAGELRRALAGPKAAAPDALLQLQRVIGNRAVGRRLPAGNGVVQRAITKDPPAAEADEVAYGQSLIHYVGSDPSVTDTEKTFSGECVRVAENTDDATATSIQSQLATLQEAIEGWQLESIPAMISQLKELVNGAVLVPSEANPVVSPGALVLAAKKSGKYWEFFRSRLPEGGKDGITDNNITQALNDCVTDKGTATPVTGGSLYHCSAGGIGTSSCSIWFTKEGNGSIRIAALGAHAETKTKNNPQYFFHWIDPVGPFAGQNKKLAIGQIGGLTIGSGGPASSAASSSSTGSAQSSSSSSYGQAPPSSGKRR